MEAGQHIGVPHLKIDPERILCAVHSDEPDAAISTPEGTPFQKAIASNLLRFLAEESKARWGGTLPPPRPDRLRTGPSRSRAGTTPCYGAGVSPNVIEAYAKAFFSAVNQLSEADDYPFKESPVGRIS